MTAESTGVEGAGACRGEGLHLVASQRPQSCSRESRKDRHLDGITIGSGRGTSRDSEQSTWHERRYVSSSERPGASHFPRATGAWPSHLEFPTVEGDGPWNRRVNLEHMPLELLDRIWDSVPDLGMKASRCALRWVGPFFPGSTSLTSKEIAKSNHELNVKIVVQHETYDHGKHSAKPSRAYYTDYMKDDGWQVSSFEHVEGQWEMTLFERQFGEPAT